MKNIRQQIEELAKEEALAIRQMYPHWSDNKVKVVAYINAKIAMKQAIKNQWKVAR